MKLKDFLKQFENCDPEMEIGIANSCYFISDIKIKQAKMTPSVFHGKIITIKNEGENVLLISGL